MEKQVSDRFRMLWEKSSNLAERYGEYLFFGFIFFMAVGNAGAEIFSGLLLITFLLRKSAKPDFQFLKNRAHLFLLLFFVFSALSLIHSGPFLKKASSPFFSNGGSFAFFF